MFVSKFGGSSLADAKQFKRVREIVQADKRRSLIVVSAPGKSDLEQHKITDMLYMCYQLASHNLSFDEVFEIIKSRYLGIREELGIEVDLESCFATIREAIAGGASEDYAASRGEYLNARLMAAYLGFEFVDAENLLFFSEDGQVDDDKSYEAIAALKDRQTVVPGFYGALPNGEIKTFPRGGSDVTGSFMASGVAAELYENWTDVSGFLAADPRIVKHPRPIERVTYKELRELSYMGASVLHESSIFPVRAQGIPIHIRNTNSPDAPGTLIVPERENVEALPVTGIAGKRDFKVLSVERVMMNGETGFIRKLMSVFESNEISVEHIPTGIDTVSVVVSADEFKGREKKLIEEIKIYCRPDSVKVTPGLSLVAVVGQGMISRPGVAARVCSSIAKAGVNIRMISQGTSELSIIIGVNDCDFDTTVKALYGEFFSAQA